MFSAKKSLKKNFRKKLSEEDDQETPSQKTPGWEGVPQVKKSVERKAQSLLSFDNEEEGEKEVFKVKKSAESLRLIKLVEKDKRQKRRTKPKASYTQISAGEYTTEKLVALRTAMQTSGEKFIKKDITISSLSSVGIPDASMIHAARKKRELARKMDQETPDFLPLGEERDKPSSSRLIREEEDDHSDDADGDGDRTARLGLGSVSKRYMQGRERLAMRTALQDAEKDDMVDGDDRDEVERWEEEQMRKGGAVPQTINPDEEYTGVDDVMVTQTVGLACFIPSGENEPPVDVPAVVDQLKANLRAVQEVRSQLAGRGDQFGNDAVEAEKMAAMLDKQSTDVGLRYSFYQRMRGYVRDLLKCLYEKLGEIDDIESSYHTLLKKRSKKLRDRRRLDVAEESELYDPAKQTSLSKLSQAELTARKQRAEAKLERHDRRKEKKTVISDHYDGQSTDDEEHDSEIESFQSETQSIIERRDDVFDDVHDDFCSLEEIRKRFEEWRSSFPETYSEAYIDLCLPRVFAPFVRLQMVEWNPLEENCLDFEQSEWFESLSTFGFDSRSGEILVNADDGDIQLVPRVMEKALVPKLCVLIENVWNPLSTAQTKRLASLILKLTDEYPTVGKESKAVQMLSSAVQLAIKGALENDIYLPLFPKLILEDKSGDAFNFVERQFWSCVKLLRNVSVWHILLPASVIQDLCVDGVVNRYLLLGLQYSSSSPETLVVKCEKIFQCFPKEWFSKLKARQTLKVMEPLCRFCVNLASRLRRATEGCSSQEQAKVKDRIKKIALLLTFANELESASKLHREYLLTN